MTCPLTACQKTACLDHLGWSGAGIGSVLRGIDRTGLKAIARSPKVIEAARKIADVVRV